MICDDSFEVSPVQANQRLDCVLLNQYNTTSRAFCRQAIENHQVLVGGQVREKGYKVHVCDRVIVLKLKERSDQKVQPDSSLALEIVFEDAALVAVNKPAGIAVHPLSSEERGTLMNGVVARYPELATLGDQPLMAGALHRIDTETSGVVIAARSQEAFEALREQFTEQRVEKIYWALVEGHIALPAHVTHHLAHHPGLPYCKMVDARTLSENVRQFPAETAYRPLELRGKYTLLEVTIFTGVTHQIRCHLALAGFPIVNDVRYGARVVQGCTRHFLHAREIRFQHPLNGQACRVQSPLTPDFKAFLKNTCT